MPTRCLTYLHARRSSGQIISLVSVRWPRCPKPQWTKADCSAWNVLSVTTCSSTTCTSLHPRYSREACLFSASQSFISLVSRSQSIRLLSWWHCKHHASLSHCLTARDTSWMCIAFCKDCGVDVLAGAGLFGCIYLSYRLCLLCRRARKVWAKIFSDSHVRPHPLPCQTEDLIY